MAIFIKGLANNPKAISHFAGFPMTREEGRDLWDKGLVPEDIYLLYKKYDSNPYKIPNEELKKFGLERNL